GTDIGAFEFQPPATTTTLTSSLNPANVGQTVTFTATVTANAANSNALGGSVTFFDGSTALATVAVNSSGVATFSTSTLSAGTHTIIAVYNGFTGPGFSFTASTSTAVNEVIVVPSPGIIVAGADAGLVAEVRVFDAVTRALKFDLFPFPLSFR